MLSITEQAAATLLLSDVERRPGHFYAMGLTDLIRKRRKELGLTQRDLAHALNISHGAVGQWEAGTSSPDHDKIPVICALLQIDMKRDLAPSDQSPGQFIDDPKELAIIGAFRLMDAEMRNAVLRIFISRLGTDSNAAD